MDKLQISLKAARVNANLTIRAAAREIGYSPSTVMKWEKNSGLVNPIVQSKISKAYGIPIDAIFFGSELEFKSSKEEGSGKNGLQSASL